MPPAIVLTALLVVLAIFQFALALGAPLGRFAWGGQHRVLPRGLRIGSAAAILIYALIAGIVWDRVGAIVVFSGGFAQIAMWVVFAYFALGVVMNAVSRSAPERWTMVPTSVVLAVCAFLIALGFGELATAVDARPHAMLVRTGSADWG